MNKLSAIDMVLPGVRAPLSMVRDPSRFGGARDRDCLVGDLVIRDGRIAAMSGGATQAERMITTRFADPHIHLDKCHTAGRIAEVGGDLRAAIAAQFEDKANWTYDDVRRRAGQGLDELIAFGCGAARSHVDWPGGEDAASAPASWRALVDLAAERRSDICLQLAPLISIESLFEPGAGDFIAQEAANVGGALGCFVLDQLQRREGVEIMFDLAEKYGLPLDFHVDEGLQPGLDGLSIIADVAIERGFQGPVLCGHACSLMNVTGDDLARVIDKIARSGISVVSLPTTNLYLQDRSEGAPDRRGLTRVEELEAKGVTVALGADNVCDAFCPVGRHDPLNTLSLAVLAAHLDPPLSDHLPKISSAAERAMGVEPSFIDGARIEDILSFNVASTHHLVAGGASPTPLSDLVAGETA